MSRRLCAQILLEAADLIDGQRNDQHGDKNANFTNIARLWSAYLGVEVSPEDVAFLMVLLKMARRWTGCFNRDDYLDLCGYAGIGYELALAEAEAEQNKPEKEEFLETLAKVNREMMGEK
jgi:hypothetical protein